MRSKPFVTLKLAQTLDGCIATTQGDSKWITSEASRRKGHQLRADADAIMVGAGTVRADDPTLNVRLVEGKDPTKVVLDSQLSIDKNAKIFGGAPLILVANENVSDDRVRSYIDAGALVWQVGCGDDERLDLETVMMRLHEHGMNSLLIEGGSQVAASALKAQIVDRVVVFLAPKILGGGLPSVGALGFEKIAEAIQLDDILIEQIGNDVMYSARPIYA